MTSAKPEARPGAAPAVTVERIAVRKDRISLIVRVSEDAPLYTNPDIARRVAAACPTVVHHACVNDVGPTFGAVIDSTPLPHLLEHLIIDAQVRESGALTEKSFVGTTEWLDERERLARVEVNFSDDLEALRAVRRALSLLNGEAVVADHVSTHQVRPDQR